MLFKASHGLIVVTTDLLVPVITRRQEVQYRIAHTQGPIVITCPFRLPSPVNGISWHQLHYQNHEISFDLETDMISL